MSNEKKRYYQVLWIELYNNDYLQIPTHLITNKVISNTSFVTIYKYV